MTTHLHSDPTRTTPLGMTRYAHEFLEAGLAVDDAMGHRRGFEIMAPVPALYLMGHGIELVLKAYLLHKGVPLKELYKFGHNLHKSLRKGKELGLTSLVQLSAQEDGAFELLDALYSTKQLEYIVTGTKQVPIFGLVQAVGLKLFNGISPEVGYGKQFEGYSL